MKAFAALAAVVAASYACAQAQKLEASYAWSLSGKEYATVSTPLRELAPGLSLALSVGWEAKDTLATVWGPSLSWTWRDRSGFELGLGAAVLFGPARPDFAVGLTFGVRL